MYQNCNCELVMSFMRILSMKPEKELNRQDRNARITKKVVVVFAVFVAVRLDDDVAGGNSVEIGSVDVDVSSDAVCSGCSEFDDEVSPIVVSANGVFAFCDFVSINFNSKSPPQTSSIPPI